MVDVFQIQRYKTLILKQGKIHIPNNTIYFWIISIIILLPTFPNILTNQIGLQCVFLITVIIAILSNRIRLYHFSVDITEVIVMLYFIYATLWDLGMDIVRGTALINDFFELLKPIAFILFYCMFRYSNVPIVKLQWTTYKAIWNVFIIISIYCILEFIFPQVFRPISLLFWKYSAQQVLIDKAIGSFFTTYNFAYILMFPLFISFIRMLMRFSLSSMLIFISLLLTLLLAQSKSMYLCAGIGLVMCLLLPFNYATIKRTIGTLLFIVVFTGFVSYIFVIFNQEIQATFTYAYEGLERISTGEAGTTKIRQAQIEWAFDHNGMLLIGNGIGKGESVLLESLYALYYYRYGIIGLALILTICLTASLKSLKLGNAAFRGSDKIAPFYWGASIFFLLTPIGTMSSCHQDMPKVSFLFYGVLGLIVARYRLFKQQSG